MAVVDAGHGSISDVSDGGYAHVFDTNVAYTSGFLASFRENGDEQAAIDYQGAYSIGGTDVLTSGRLVQAADGSAGGPAHSFSGDTDTGVYRIGADNLGIATGGTKAVDIDSSQNVTVSSGSLTVSGEVDINSAALRMDNTETFFFADSSGTDRSVVNVGSSDEVKLGANAGWSHIELGNNIPVFINESANANQTIGLTINQGASDDELFAGKSSDVAHVLTNETEADTYLTIKKGFAANGAGVLRGFVEGTRTALFLQGGANAADTTKSTAGNGVVEIRGSVNSTNSFGGLGADGNILTVTDNGTTRFIFDAEGSFHADVGSTTFDRYDDLAVLEDMESIMAPGQVDRRFSEVLQHDRDFFEREGLFHDIRETEPGKMRGMMNVTRMTMLHSGAIRQVGGMVLDLEEEMNNRIAALEDENRALRQQVQALLN